MPVALNHAAAAAYRGGVYVLGGYRGAAGSRTRPPRSTATTRSATAGRAQPSAPTARGALAVGVIGHRLYAAGGATPQRGALDTLEIYDFARRRWRSGPGMRVAARAPRRRRRRRSLLRARRPRRRRRQLRRRRGVRPAHPPLARACAPMRKPRGGIAAATVGGRIVVVGGEEDAGTIREVELYDPAHAPLAPPAGPADAAPRPRRGRPRAAASTCSRAATSRASRSPTRSRG